MRIWDDILTERDKALLELTGYGMRAGFGQRPAVLVIDTTYAFCGDRPEPILESVKRWRNSCGLDAWAAVGNMVELITAARAKRIPVMYSTGGLPLPPRFAGGRALGKNRRRPEDQSPERVALGNEIVAPIAPRPDDIVLRKIRPSVFHGTPLLSLLTDLHVDTLICCGGTTSGCVRATVLDAFSYSFRVAVVEECTFDRTQSSHKINLFDINQKYGDVVGLRESLEYVATLTEGLFDDVMSTRVPAAAAAARS